ncbi:hypothetical protein AMELA_G00062520 [Ameiurus melas]|uniref:Uncharacterized protein n=1 Tax=Ameiurus melas TaxID=219545 RepID=A0A7J6B5U1_AMEME|nr:hypothetical protein AMELA_G00062520 [Ameiurus melas]
MCIEDCDFGAAEDLYRVHTAREEELRSCVGFFYLFIYLFIYFRIFFYNEKQVASRLRASLRISSRWWVSMAKMWLADVRIALDENLHQTPCKSTAQSGNMIRSCTPRKGVIGKCSRWRYTGKGRNHSHTGRRQQTIVSYSML